MDDIIYLGENETSTRDHHSQKRDTWPKARSKSAPKFSTYTSNDAANKHTPYNRRPYNRNYSSHQTTARFEPQSQWRFRNENRSDSREERSHFKQQQTRQQQHPSSMQNRYFSVENASLIKNSQTSQSSKDKNDQEDENNSDNETQNTEHSKEFNERKESLLKKLFQSRNLPTNENTFESQNEEEKEENEPSKSEKKTETESTESKIEFKPYKPDRKHEFQDDFIPLFGSGTKSEEKSAEDVPKSSRINESSESDDDIEDITESVKKVYDPKLNVFDSYKGPYSVRCLTKARQHLIEAFKSTSFAHTDRTFEILKVKLNIKSKFDNDIKLKRRIKRDTQAVRQIIQDKLDLYYKRCHNNPIYMRPAHYKSKSQQHIRFNDSETNLAKRKNRIQTIDIELDESSSSSVQHKESDDEVESENENTSDNEEDVIKMINEPENVINLSDDEEEEEEEDDDDRSENDIQEVEDDDEEEEQDSKYVQFGKYSKNSSSKNSTKPTHTSSRQTTKRKRIKSRSNNESDDEQLEEHFFSKVLKKTSSNSKKFTNQSKQQSENDNDENKLENLEFEYKNIRNKRNKLLRKRKGDEVQVERKLMSDQLKLIRRKMKKLRKKKFNKFDFSRSNRYFEMLDGDEEAPFGDSKKANHRNKGHLKYALNKKPQNLVAFQSNQTKNRNNNKKQAKVILNNNKKSNNKFGKIKTNKQNF